MKLLSIVGARPQLIEAAILIRSLDEYAIRTGVPLEHHLLHTGQHYDSRLSHIFFRQLRLPTPDVSLGIGSAGHGVQTAAMLASIEVALNEWRPDAVIVYGDANSTLAGALAASKLRIPVIHLEAGLRSFNKSMPEEINRVISDHVAALLLCPTNTAIKNLTDEGLSRNSVVVGDVMLDAVLRYGPMIERNPCLDAFGLKAKEYALVTLYRAENIDNAKRLEDMLRVLEGLALPTLLPMHPRLKDSLGKEGHRRLSAVEHLHMIEPVGYLEMLALERDSQIILTDSGGVQREAYFFGIPCLTLRDQTEWVETLQGGWNQVVGTNPGNVLPAARKLLANPGMGPSGTPDLSCFGDGLAGWAAAEAIFSLRNVN